ncbi:hypothetical protein CsSME_00015016 [Camellia sinensis var. sinensis]
MCIHNNSPMHTPHRLIAIVRPRKFTYQRKEKRRRISRLDKFNERRPLESTEFKVETDCTQYDSQENDSVVVHNARNANSSFNLDDSQKADVLSCLDTRECHHQISVKLIWGPPRTRKTKTVGSLLFVLFRMKCRTLTCAPTNIAVLGVATRLMSLVRKSFQYDTYGLGDIVSFCNGEKAKIDDHEDLIDVFLDYCISVLASCFALMSGWNNSVESMICLLEDAELLYQLYLEKKRRKITRMRMTMRRMRRKR